MKKLALFLAAFAFATPAFAQKKKTHRLAAWQGGGQRLAGMRLTD